ncbi:hypothetical protein A1O1_08654 [Capronia coronata CBS 617.96]|uniref:Nudix hydrolase domain-containing protein n=1 Tax=Capronia coronata CBS 617.96 TaxID=1182541 RepID=W9YDW7_9EURO|nr:uncharacterized protein A1O1_08654 [Capronia coronata CBS 617.96]EXJ80509.1 hypothetical protein A1O1_08654 [Capronia coronata CBS 617.96]
MSKSAPSPSTATFILPNSNPDIPITHPTSLNQDQILTFPAFKTWLRTLQKSLALQQRQKKHPFHAAPYSLRSIEIQSVDFFSGHRLGFLKMKATVANGRGESLPGSVFMRGGSVAMMIVLTPEMRRPKPNDNKTDTDTDPDTDTDLDTATVDGGGGSGKAQVISGGEEYVILTLQPRIAAGSLSFVELPAGMIDDSGSFAGAAAREIQEETGLEIAAEELIDMTQLALRARRPTTVDRGQKPAERDTNDTNHSTDTDLGPDPETQDATDADEPHLQAAVYPSPGGSDEFIPIFLVRKRLPRAEIDQLKGKLTGLRDDGEKITLKIVRLDEVWKVAGRDGKTLAALALYAGLKGEGRI